MVHPRRLQRLQQMMLEATLVKDEESGKYVDQPYLMAHPQSYSIYLWNSIIVTFILIGALLLPFQLAFNSSATSVFDSELTGKTIVLLLMDIFFILDVAVTLRTGLMDDGEVLFDKRLITLRYFHTWLFVDLVSALSSIVVVGGLLAGQEAEMITTSDGIGVPSLSAGNKVMRVVRMLRMLKVLKLLKLSRMHTALDFLDHVPTEMKTAAKMLKLCIYVVKGNIIKQH